MSHAKIDYSELHKSLYEQLGDPSIKWWFAPNVVVTIQGILNIEEPPAREAMFVMMELDMIKTKEARSGNHTLHCISPPK
jgi:hypothetical protein